MELKKPEDEAIDKWFMKEIFLWRKAGSVFWFMTCLPVLTVLYILAANISIFHPIQTVKDVIMTVFSPSIVARLMFIMIVNGCFVSYSSLLFSVQPEIGETRLENFLRLIRVNRLPHIIASGLSGLLLVWNCSGFIGERFSNLTQSPDGLVVQLNEHHLFLVLYGLYVGVSYYCSFHLNHSYYLEFPIMQREKFFRIRSSVGSLFICNIKQTLKEVKYYYLFYYLFGGTVRSWVAFNLNLQYSGNDLPLNSIFGLFNFSLFWQIIIFGVYVNFNWWFAHLLFRVYQTEHYEFPVENVFDGGKHRYLSDALSCNLQPLVKYLGFLDLCYLAKFSRDRRQQIFSLSQPGGHPHAWSRICAACLAELDDLNCQIEAANWKAYASVPVKQQTIIDKSHVHGDSTNGLMFYRSSEHSTTNQNNKSLYNDKTETNAISSKGTIVVWKEKISALVSKKPVIGYIMGELPDAKSRKLFALSQIQIWSVEALSYLISASYTEDSYGIVQKSLPKILACILTLQENVGKHFKLVIPLIRRVQRDSCTVNDTMLRHQLQSVLKSSIHRIINKFGKHIYYLPLDNDSIKKLRPFMEYTE